MPRSTAIEASDEMTRRKDEPQNSPYLDRERRSIGQALDDMVCGKLRDQILFGEIDLAWAVIALRRIEELEGGIAKVFTRRGPSSDLIVEQQAVANLFDLLTTAHRCRVEGGP